MSLSTRSSLSATSAIFLAVAVIGKAAVPDAGGLLRDQPPVEPPPRRLPQDDKIETPSPGPAGALTIQPLRFVFRGYEGLVSETELQAIVASYVGRTLGMAELQGVAAEVTALLKKKGYFLARAYLPRQDVTDGTVEIAILQARLDGDVTIQAEGTRVAPELLKSITGSLARTDRPLNERDLERVLLTLNDLPGVSAKAILEPGASPGTTRLIVDVDEGPVFSGGLWADNFGNRHTGTWRGNGLLTITDPFGAGDQGTVLLSASEGLRQGRLAYNRPFGGRGLRGHVAYTAMSYELVGNLKAMEAEGRAQTVSAWLSQPFIRNRAFTFSGTIGYDFKALADELFGIEVKDKRIHSGTAGISATWQDNWLGGGLSTVSVEGTFGHIDLSGVKADERMDRLTARSAGGFTRLNPSASRLQRIGQGLTLYGAYNGQLAFESLDSSEKMSLGGPYGVRAYPVGEASGDEAHLFSLELRQTVPAGLSFGTLEVSAFADAGCVTLHKTPWPLSIETMSGKNEYWLSGGGIGVSLSKAGRYLIRASYAHRIGENDGRSPLGTDADGRDDDGRFWLIAQLSL